MAWTPRPWIGPLPENVPLARRAALAIVCVLAALVCVDASLWHPERWTWPKAD